MTNFLVNQQRDVEVNRFAFLQFNYNYNIIDNIIGMHRRFSPPSKYGYTEVIRRFHHEHSNS